jgi:hypothetical protein
MQAWYIANSTNDPNFAAKTYFSNYAADFFHARMATNCGDLDNPNCEVAISCGQGDAPNADVNSPAG